MNNAAWTLPTPIVHSPFPDLPQLMEALLKLNLKCGTQELELFKRFGLRDLCTFHGFCSGNGENILPLFSLAELLQLPTVCFICKVQLMEMALVENRKEWVHGCSSERGVLKLAAFWAFNGCELYVKHLQQQAHLPTVGFSFAWSDDIAPLHSIAQIDF